MDMIPREILISIRKWIGDEKILVLKWPRQVGKTTIMRELQRGLEADGHKTLFFSADIELGNDIFLSAKHFINFLKTQLSDTKIYIFIDEFQYIPEAWRFLKWVFDELRDQIQLIVSWSSSLEITKNSEFLTGRKIDFEISGISFFEYITYASQYSYTRYTLDEISEVGWNVADILEHFLTYIRYGSYPEVLVTQDIEKKQILLQNIIATYISKDVALFMKIENIHAFNNLLTVLSHQTGNLLNRSELSNTLNIDDRKLSHYLDILVGTYVIKLVTPYYTNIRKELSKMPKIYFQNIGLIQHFTHKTIMNTDTIEGNIIENMVYIFLAEITKNTEHIHYYRTIAKSEIDFIIESGNGLIPIEVKYRNKVGNMPVAVNNFAASYTNVSKKILITKHELSVEGNNYKLPFYLLPFVKEL